MARYADPAVVKPIWLTHLVPNHIDRACFRFLISSQIGFAIYLACFR